MIFKRKTHHRSEASINSYNIYDTCNHESNVLVRLSPHWFCGS